MGRVLIILSVIFVLLGIIYSVKTHDSYLSYKSLVGNNHAMLMTSAAATFFAKTFSFSSEAYAGNTPAPFLKPQMELPQRGTKEFETYEEFQTHALTAFLCYFCGYAALSVARRLTFEWQRASV